MLFLIGISLSAGLFLIFRAFHQYKINTFQAIVCNYWTCVLTALVYVADWQAIQNISFDALWVKVPFFLGFLFISTFYLMGFVAQNISVSAASVAAKISLIIPVLFNLILFENQSKFDFINYTGLILVFVAIFFTSNRVESTETQARTQKSWGNLILIALIFLMSGAIDTSINWVSKVSATDATSQAIFSMLVFAVAGVIGLLILLQKVIFQKEKMEWKNLVAGVILGVVNYFSVIFMIKSLQNEFSGNGAFFFPIFNIGIILLSTFFAVLFFKEKLNQKNKLGILFSILAIICMAYQAIGAYLKN
jgi:drug/metabolite transporter (DMT)-like permease